MNTRHGHISSISEMSAWRARFLYRVVLSRAAYVLMRLFVAAALLVAGSRIMAQSAAPSAKADQALSGNAANGRKLFAKYGCYECHGREAQGGGISGPRLAPDPVPFSVIQSYIRHPHGDMPQYTDKVVSDKDLADIYAFLAAQPQPPAVKAIPILKH